MKKATRFLTVFVLVLAVALALLPAAALADDGAASGQEGGGSAEPLPAPMVIVSRGDMQAVQAGQQQEITVTFQNLGDTPLLSPVATFNPPDDLTIVGGSNAFPLSDIPAKGTQSLKLTILGASTITSASLKVEVELRFNYDNGVTVVQSTASDKLTLPATVTKTPEKVTNPQPTVIVTRSGLGGPISAGQTVDLTVTFQNAGQTAIVGPVASFSTSEGLVLLNDSSTFPLGDIAPGATASAALKLKAGKEISSSTQSVTANLKFTYDSGSGMEQGTSTEQVNLSANTSAPSYSGGGTRTSSPVPNIIIDSYRYGGDSVAAGGRFQLAFTFHNTGKLNIENCVVTIDGGDSFTMDGSTNTFYYQQVAAGAAQDQQVPMQALATAKTGAQTVTVGFKYEYVDGGTRSTTNADIKLSIPIYQPDRFEVDKPTVPEKATVGEELALSLNFANKGKAEVSNVEAVVEGNVDTPAATQYLGNFESGKSGSIGFALTPREAGETKITLTVTYEDANQQTRKLTFPVTLNVQAPVYVSDQPLEGSAGTTGSSHGWIWALIAGLLVVGGGAFALIRRKKHAGAKTEAAGDAVWDQWNSEPDGETPSPAAGEARVPTAAGSGESKEE